MKTVTANALAELSKNHGTEPLVLIGIEWVLGSVTLYSDKELPGVKAKILSLGTIDNTAIGNQTTQSVEVTLDDTDNEIKQTINENNVHKIKATIYQYYNALNDLADKFVIFDGQISTPFDWSEKERSVKFTVVSEIESFEVGFSPEEGQLEFVNDEFIGKPWPLCFGNVVHVPAQRVSQTLEGQLLDEVCVLDQTLVWRLERLRLAYFQEAYLMKFYVQVANGAQGLCPPVEQIITMYVQAILSERAIIGNVIALLDVIDNLKKGIKEGFAGIKPILGARETDLDVISLISHLFQQQKEYVEGLSKLAEFKYKVEKEALTKAIEAYNNMRQIYHEYVSVQNEMCKQNECAVGQVRIQGGKRFPQNQLIDVYIKDVKFRGTFVDDLFTFFDVPTAKYHNVPLDPWQKDDDTCIPQDESNGVNLIWLKNVPPENLTGLYLLVKKRGGDPGVRHIIQVERQVGQKVYYKLITWANVGSGAPNSYSIEDTIERLFDAPFVPNPWRQPLTGSDFFTDPWLTSEWNQPEPIRLLEIISQIPGGVNGHELEILAKLVYLEPHDKLSGLILLEPSQRDVYTIVGEDVEEIVEASSMVHKHWLENWSIPFEEIPDTIFWNAEAGSTVRLEPKDCVVYIANILPSAVHAVHAYRTLENGSRILSPVPSSYYVKNEMASLGAITVTSLTFPYSLENIAGEGWENDIYVTLSSTIGPNVCDIIQWLIETYTDVGVNASNFAAIKDKFLDINDDELYPANFALFDRPNVLEEVARIAWEARCAIYRIGNEFFLKYLSEEPSSDMTFTESDIDSDSHVSISFPSTESLVTRMIAYWEPHYLPLQQGDKPTRIVLRNNVKRYGLHSEDVQFHIYNIKELVVKSATFWMIRQSNTWKRVQFKTFLTKIRLDTFDTVLFDLAQTFLAENDIKGIVQSIQYEPVENSLLIDVEIPVRAGEMVEYHWYWPADKPATDEFPQPIEIVEGFAGGYGPGDDVTGTIDDC